VVHVELALSQEAEEYIEIIYKLQKQNGKAKTKELAETLHVVPGSITNTIEHLESHGLVAHEPYRGVRLTRDGEKIALGIIRKHRLAECLLADVLKADWSTVHEDACKLEHALTKSLVSLIDERLGHPKFCPHGNPIPSENGIVEDKLCVPLTELELGETCKVDRIVDEEHSNLRLLSEKGIRPQTIIQVIKRESSQIEVKVENNQFGINHSLASNVLVKKSGHRRNSDATTT
jgi:DtxR family transcriptional regulator, Mn-dependent transcriptional regulator